MTMRGGRHRRPLPAWLVGMVVAVLVFALILIVTALLGFGDDPVIEGLAAF